MIDGNTQVIAILGFPISHTRSPRMHNFALQKKGLNIIYVPFPVPPGSLKSAVEGLRGLHFLGANVTLPHKEAVTPLLDALSPASRIIGAVNTIVNRKGRLFGTTTDPDGILLALHRAGVDFRRRPITLLGTGGAARTALFTFLMRGHRDVAVAGRRPEKASAWVREARRRFGAPVQVFPLKGPKFVRRIEETRLLVNCTTVGMAPSVRHSPIPLSLLHKGMVVFDMVYHPPETYLITEAKRRGIKTVGGLSMLAFQGMAAFKLWTGKSPAYGDFYGQARAA